MGSKIVVGHCRETNNGPREGKRLDHQHPSDATHIFNRGGTQNMNPPRYSICLLPPALTLPALAFPPAPEAFANLVPPGWPHSAMVCSLAPALLPPLLAP